MRDDELVRFLQWALPRLRMRWPGFRKVRRQVRRRIAARMEALGLADLEAYRARLEAHPEEWAVLDDFCRITISRFYRDRSLWDALRADALPLLAARARGEGRALRAWSAGCASGEEPYTLRLCWDLDLAARFPDVALQVLATDVGERVLARARAGRYPPGSLKDLPAEWRAQAFVPEGEELRLVDAFREGVHFARADLRQDLPGGPFDLILCRHLAFTYFAPDQQRVVLRELLARLRPGGALVTGRKETLPAGPFDLEPWGREPGLYRFAPAASR